MPAHRQPLIACVLVAVVLPCVPAPVEARHKHGPAPAAVAATPASAEDEARELYKKGMTHYELGEFDPAIDEFKRAYALTSAPGLLFNLAQVYRMKKDPEQAVYFYRTYLRLVPNAPNRADVEALLAENQALVDAARAKKRAADEAAAAAAGAAAAARGAAVPPSPAPPPPPPSLAPRAVGRGRRRRARARRARRRGRARRALLVRRQQIASADAQRGRALGRRQAGALARRAEGAAAATGLYVAGGVVAAAGVALGALGVARSRARPLLRRHAVPGGAAGDVMRVLRLRRSRPRSWPAARSARR